MVAYYISACKESCPTSKREICGMRPKTFKNKCMIDCLNKNTKGRELPIMVIHEGKCIAGKGN